MRQKNDNINLSDVDSIFKMYVTSKFLNYF